MPAASTKACSGCGASSSRYNCPSCPAATCSLACSKAHKASHGGASPAASSSSSSPSPAPSTSAYIPLARYNENHLYDDLTFLSHVGRHVGNIGKELTRHPWSRKYLSDVEGQPASADAKGKAKAQRPNQREQQRELLRKQAQWLKVPLMLLPDGMQMRRDNRTAWMHKAQKMVYTAQLRFRAALEQPVLSGGKLGQSSEALIHRLEPDVAIEGIILEELERRSSAILKQLGGPEDARKAKGGSPFRVLPIVLASHGLAPFPTSLNLPLDPTPSLLEHEAFKPVHLTHLPPNTAICLLCHSDRLRNETSHKFLDWWARQVAKGLDPTEEVGKAKGQEERVRAEEPQREMRVWGARPADAPQVVPPQSSPPPPEQPPSSSLISASLLGRLSAQLKGNSAAQAASAGTSQSAAAVSPASVPPPRAPRAMLHVIPETSPTTTKTVEPPPIQPRKMPQQILLRLPLSSSRSSSSSSTLPLQPTLQSLPTGLAILEYPQFEIWGEQALDRAAERREVVIRQWEGGEGGGGEDGKAMQGQEVERKRPANDGVEDSREQDGKRGRFVQPLQAPAAVASSPEQLVKAKPVKPLAAPPKLTSLVGYGSDSDTDEEGQGSKEEDNDAKVDAGAEEERRMANIARSELLIAQPTLGLDGTGTADEEGEEDRGMGMAAYARALGLVPARIEAHVSRSSAPASASPPLDQEVQLDRSASAARSMVEEEEEEVDWGEEEEG